MTDHATAGRRRKAVRIMDTIYAATGGIVDGHFVRDMDEHERAAILRAAGIDHASDTTWDACARIGDANVATDDDPFAGLGEW